MNTINIMALIPNRTDATSLYRGLGPLAALRREMDINIIFSEKVDEALLDMVDLVFMQRPSSASHYEIAKMCESNNTPLWLDYDDLLMAVPEDNPAHNDYMNKPTIERLMNLIKIATVVTVSTPQLKRAFQKPGASLNDRIYVVPNALPDKFLRFAKPFNTATQHINWRGGTTHQRDLAEYTPQIVDIGKTHPNSTLTFIGWNPWFITQSLPAAQAIVVPGMPLTEYFRFMSATNPPIQIVPLHDSLFNRCKSNIAWLESCLTGAVCIAPHWEEWAGKPGIMTFNSKVEFVARVNYALSHPLDMAEKHAEGWDYIKKNLLLSQINHQRRHIIEALAGVNTFPAGGDPV